MDNSAPRARRPRPWQNLNTEWEGRAALAVQYLQDVNSVLDIGCGRMTLKRLLPAKVAYQGLDIVPRDESTIVIDLNAQPLPDLDHEAAVVLGVVEYLRDPPAFFERLRQFDRLILSYNCVSIKDRLTSLGLARSIPAGWVNRLRRHEIEALIGAAGFSIIARHRVRIGEYLWVGKHPPGTAG